jgi:hypothetical protein
VSVFTKYIFSKDFFQSHSSPLTNIKTFYFSIFATSLFYGFCVSVENKLLDNIAAIFYVLSLTLLFLWSVRLPKKNSMFIFIPIILHLGILPGGMSAHDPTKFFWGSDSIDFHIPLSKIALNDVKSLFTLQAKRYGSTILITHLITGIFFKILGVSVFATTLSMLFIKIPTAFLINMLGKRLFTPAIGYFSTLLFLLYPSVIVFDAIFFKEITIQFLLIGFFVLLYDFVDFKKVIHFIPMLFLLFFSAHERSYIVPSMLISLIFSSYLFMRNFSIKKKVGILGIVFLTLLGFVYFFSSLYPPSQIIQKMLAVRAEYQSIPSVNTKWNYEIPYILAIPKIIFTPFFMLKKFDTYFNLTSLIVWSIPINQFIIFTSILGMLQSLKNNNLHYPIIASFVFYILLLAYFRPYDGRVRDSYIPIILIFSLSYICSFIKKMNVTNSTNELK